MSRAVRCLAAPLLGALLASCGSALAAQAPNAEWSDASRAEAARLAATLAALPPAPPGEVRVDLAFGRGADLDLYETGPLEETVYYANTPSAVGGELVADRHCEEGEGDVVRADGPGIETVRFAAAPAGRYRVGLDYPHVCQGDPRPVPFVVQIDTPEGRLTRRGIAAFEFFQPLVIEFEVPSQETRHAP